MSITTTVPTWEFTCEVANCELRGFVFTAFGTEAECGGCNTIFTKPASGDGNE
jgi:ribosomal protein S27E